MKDIKDHEYAELPQPAKLAEKEESEKFCSAITHWSWFLLGLWVLMGLFFFNFGPKRAFHGPDELIHAEYVVSQAAHQLAIRAECNETNPLFQSAVDAATAHVLGFSGSISASQVVTDASQTANAASTESTPTPAGESVPVSTQTALSTIYSIRSTSEQPTLTSTTIGTTTITVSPTPAQYTEASVSDDTCSAVVTETVLVTIYPVPPVTVTAGASTVTYVNTDVSYTSGLPDVTLSQNPSTYTAVQTDVTYTTGPQDATVPGDPATVTNVQTDVSTTTGPPDATVSGDPSTVTDVQVSWSWPLTTTYTKAFTTVTITDLFGSVPPASTAASEQPSLSTFTTIISSQVIVTVSFSTASASSDVAGEVTSTSPSPTSTYTQVVTVTDGPPVIDTTTVDVPPPAYTDSNSTTSTATSSIATPIVISHGNKRPEPKAWGGSNGSSNVSCAIMLITVFMFLL